MKIRYATVGIGAVALAALGASLAGASPSQPVKMPRTVQVASAGPVAPTTTTAPPVVAQATTAPVAPTTTAAPPVVAQAPTPPAPAPTTTTAPFTPNTPTPGGPQPAGPSAPIPGAPGAASTGVGTLATITGAAAPISQGAAAMSTYCAVTFPGGYVVSKLPCGTAFTDFGGEPGYAVTRQGPVTT